MRKKLKLGIVADEFFDRAIGRMGGFGWAARQVARCFNGDPSLNVEAVFVSGEHRGETDLTSHDTRLIRINRSVVTYTKRLRDERFDLLLMIDYRATFRRLFLLLPRTPIVVWARDPRTLENNERVRAISIPGREDLAIPGAGSSRGNIILNYLMKASSLVRRPVQIAYTAQFLIPRIETSYNVRLTESNSMLLPNIVDITPPSIDRSARPKFAFLGRLDPYKRPWIFLKLAEEFPNADFVVMGRSHFGDDGWKAESISSNVRFLGHVDETEKAYELASSWAIVNTSVHEGLAVSLQEALKSETPIVASVDPENIVSRFGIYVGDFPGKGLESIPHFVSALSRLIDNEELRRELGQAGANWVKRTHSKDQFLAAFSTLCERTGVEWTKQSARM